MFVSCCTSRSLVGWAQAGTETVLARIQGAKKLTGVDKILLPGEGGSSRAAAVAAKGEVSIEKNLYDGMKEVSPKEDGGWLRLALPVSWCEKP